MDIVFCNNFILHKTPRPGLKYTDQRPDRTTQYLCLARKKIDFSMVHLSHCLSDCTHISIFPRFFCARGFPSMAIFISLQDARLTTIQLSPTSNIQLRTFLVFLISTGWGMKWWQGVRKVTERGDWSRENGDKQKKLKKIDFWAFDTGVVKYTFTSDI